MLRSDLYDFSDAYIVVKGKGTVARTSSRSRKNRPLAFKNNSPFISCIPRVNNTLIDNAEDLDVVMPMYNLIEYRKKYRKTTASLWDYYREELTEDTNDINFLNKNLINSESFKYKTSITGSTYNVDAGITNAEGNQVDNPAYDANNYGKKEVEIVWRMLKMPLIHFEVSLILTQSTEFVITSLERRVITNTQRDTIPKNAKIQITDTKLYVPVVALLTENEKILLEQLRTGFKRTIKWNKYRSEMTNQTKTNHLNYLIDPKFIKVNRLFVSSFENEEDRTSFSKYYVPKVEIKDFNVLINRKIFFDIPIKNNEETYEQIIEMGRNNDYTTDNLLDYEHFSKHCKFIAIDLSKQIELENPDLNQQVNFVGRLERNQGATMFFIIEKSEKMIKIIQFIVKEMKMVQPLNLNLKSLSQIFVIIQKHIFL